MGKGLNKLLNRFSWECFPMTEHTKYALSKLSIAHALTRRMGWGSSEPPEPADEEIGVKPTLNAGSSLLK